LYVFLIPSMHATYLTYNILLDIIILTTECEGYKLRNLLILKLDIAYVSISHVTLL
jgi:hypothetical protein